MNHSSFTLSPKKPSVLLISLEDTFIAFSVRYLASALRTQEIDADILFSIGKPKYRESDSELDSMIDWIRNRDYTICGISLLSIDFTRAKRITQKIKRSLNLPVIWGGVHAILKPEDSLEYADYVCVGEGEISFPIFVKALFNGKTDEEFENIWHVNNGEIIKSPRSLVSDPDALPHPDFDISRHFILLDNRIQSLTVEIMKKYVPWSLNRHYVISTRGCPHNCAFCCNSALKKIFVNRKSRMRSAENLIAEINDIKIRFPFVQSIAIMDDSFLPKPPEWLNIFCSEFSKTGLKFGLLLHPRTLNKEVLEKLLNAGLIGFQMGLQSGSNAISRKIFNRSETVEDFVETARFLDAYTDRLDARIYDVIVDNPFETEEDVEQTIRVLASLNKPFNLDIFSMTFYPQTALASRAVERGLIQPGDRSFEDRDSLSYKPSMENRMIWLTHCTASRLILFFLKHRKKQWGKLLFYAYDYLWERSSRRILRTIKHCIFSLLTSLRTRSA